jgi:hypothetical protein
MHSSECLPYLLHGPTSTRIGTNEANGEKKMEGKKAEMAKDCDDQYGFSFEPQVIIKN